MDSMCITCIYVAIGLSTSWAMLPIFCGGFELIGNTWHFSYGLVHAFANGVGLRVLKHGEDIMNATTSKYALENFACKFISLVIYALKWSRISR
jgi:hypothetical protein